MNGDGVVWKAGVVKRTNYSTTPVPVCPVSTLTVPGPVSTLTVPGPVSTVTIQASAAGDQGRSSGGEDDRNNNQQHHDTHTVTTTFTPPAVT